MRVDVCLLKSIQNNKHLAYNARCGAEIKSPFKDDNSYVPCIYFFIINRQTLPLFSLLSSPVLGLFFASISGNFLLSQQLSLPPPPLSPSIWLAPLLISLLRCLLLHLFFHSLIMEKICYQIPSSLTVYTTKIYALLQYSHNT